MSGVENFDLSIKSYLKRYFKVDSDEEEDAFENNFGHVMESIVQVLDPIMFKIVKLSHGLDVRRASNKQLGGSSNTSGRSSNIGK